MRHALDGYNYLMSLGYEQAARICLTHPYPIKNAEAAADMWDGSDEEFRFIQAYLEQIEYDRYDRLIQLCDSLALPSGLLPDGKAPGGRGDALWHQPVNYPEVEGVFRHPG